MHTNKLHLFSLLLAVVLMAAGCTATNSTQPAAVVPQKTAAASGGDSAATTGQNTAQVVPQTGASSGGLVIKIDPQNSEARYRVREQLASVDLPSDAIGKTKAITGSIIIKPDGTIDSANSKFVVDVSTLQSDRSMRDNFLRRAVLQTSQYPNVTFVPTKVTGLAWPLPKSGPVTFQLTGDMTIRDVTKPVTWDVSGNIQNGQTGQALGLAKTTFTFEDFNLQQPRVPVVLSIEDHITLEVDVALHSTAQ